MPKATSLYSAVLILLPIQVIASFEYQDCLNSQIQTAESILTVGLSQRKM
jgi:hypothetical protein